jgi:hypothetical protein
VWFVGLVWWNRRAYQTAQLTLCAKHWTTAHPAVKASVCLEAWKSQSARITPFRMDRYNFAHSGGRLVVPFDGCCVWSVYDIDS